MDPRAVEELVVWILASEQALGEAVGDGGTFFHNWLQVAGAFQAPVPLEYCA